METNPGGLRLALNLLERRESAPPLGSGCLCLFSKAATLIDFSSNDDNPPVIDRCVSDVLAVGWAFQLSARPPEVAVPVLRQPGSFECLDDRN